MKRIKALCDIRPGECASVESLEALGSMRRRLLDIGLTKNTKVECIGCSPGGGICAYLIRGAVIAIRTEDGEKIKVYT